jgi:predicted aspartyl protease
MQRFADTINRDTRGGIIRMSILVRTLGASVCLALAAGRAWGQSPPDPDQQRILQTVTEFARGYLERLPDFTCIRTTQHFLAKPANKTWNLQVKVAQELSYYHHEEHYQVVAVDDVPKKKVSIWTQAGGWVETNGNFGALMSLIFDPKVAPHFEPQGRSYLHGKPVYVFNYHVSLDDSIAASAKCTSWIAFTTCKTLKYGFHGVLFVDSDSLDILRLTQVPEDLPASYAQGNESVDYGRVTVAGAEYLLPIADEFETTIGKTLFRNQSTYTAYKKFVAESTLSTTVIDAPEATPAKPVVKAAVRSVQTIQAANCFELRDEAARTKPSAIVRATVGAAFNNAGPAEKELLAVIRAHPDSEDATAAHVALSAMMQLSGRPRQALEHSALAAAADPNARNPKDMRGVLEALAKYPGQSVAARGFSRIPFVRDEDGFAITVSVNGKSSQFDIDTGAAISAISESQAKSLGMTIHDDRFPLVDISGNRVPCRLAIASQLTAGAFRLRNVPFCMLADAPEVARGILGLPVLLAFDTVRWTRDGALEIGFSSARPDIAQSNVCFDAGSLSVQVGVGDQHLAFDLDTGNGRTFLYSTFAEDFAETAQTAGARGTYEMKGLGDSVALNAAELPEIKLQLGGFGAVLRKVSLLSDPLPSTCPGCYGNAGRDLFHQASAVTLDFKAMKLTVSP